MKRTLFPLFAALAALAFIAHPPEARSETGLVNRLLWNLSDNRPVDTVPATLTADEARDLREYLVAATSVRLGPVIGYKAALTNPSVQEKFGVDHPVLGFLLYDMLVTNGSTIHQPYAARPVMEGDLLVRVSSESINDARTLREALAGLGAVIPFIELPDLVYATNVVPTAALLVAANAGARAGVYGDEIPLAPTPEWEKRLANFRVQLVDGKGKILGSGKSDAILGNPLSAVLWLRDELKAQGIRLHEGDLLSLGSITPLVPAPRDGVVRAVYTDLLPDGPIEVSVRFTSAADAPR